MSRRFGYWISLQRKCTTPDWIHLGSTARLPFLRSFSTTAEKRDEYFKIQLKTNKWKCDSPFLTDYRELGISGSQNGLMVTRRNVLRPHNIQHPQVCLRKSSIRNDTEDRRKMSKRLASRWGGWQQDMVCGIRVATVQMPSPGSSEPSTWDTRGHQHCTAPLSGTGGHCW